jgi:hypothetical protein
LDGGTFSHTSSEVVGKYLYFPNSGNKFLITAYDDTNKILTLENYTGEEPVIPEFPARLIDLATGYDFKVKSNRDSGAAKDDFRKSSSIIHKLDLSYVYNPQFSTKLDLGNTHWIQIRSLNNETLGSYTLLPSGVYDPDHSPGGQTEVSYSSPYVHTLPNLVDDGAITLDATTFGFTVDITGWYDANDSDKSAHEFEVAWTTLGSLDWNDTTNTTKTITTNRHIPISVNEAATYLVGVRALQNKQVVSLTKTSSVYSGGGGIPPNMVLVAEVAVDLPVISGTCTATRTLHTPATGDPFYTTKLENITYYDSWLSPPDFSRNEMRSQNGRPPEVEIEGHTFNGDFNRVLHNDATDDPSPTITVFGELDVASISSSTKFTIGTTKASRKLYQASLEADYTIKKIVMDVDVALGVSAANPGVIRVYQKDNESAYGGLDVGTSNALLTQTVNVEIKQANEAARTLIIDAFDPDPTSPNNECALIGTIKVYGEPIVTRSSSGATVQS